MRGQKEEEIKEDRKAWTHKTKAIKHKGLNEERSEMETRLFHTVCESDGGILKEQVRQSASIASAHLLWVVGHVRQHGGHVEHDLIALVGGVQGVCSRGIS